MLMVGGSTRPDGKENPHQRNDSVLQFIRKREKGKVTEKGDDRRGRERQPEREGGGEKGKRKTW